MRILSVLLAGLLATWSLPAMGAEDAAPRQGPVRIAFGALHRLQPGQAFVYELRFPDPVLALGSIRPRVPSREEDFKTRLFRLVVMEPTPPVLGEDVWLRLDTLDGRDEVRTRGLYYIQLGTDEDGRLGADSWDATMYRGSTSVWDPREVPFVFDYYPTLGVLPVETGREGPQYDRDLDEVLEWSFSADRRQKVVALDAHRFYHVGWLRYDKLQPDARNNVRFFDKNAEAFLPYEPSGGRHDILAVAFQGVETQKWDFGAPLWKHMVRRNQHGALKFECTFVGKYRIPPNGVSQRFQKLYRDWRYQLHSGRGIELSARTDTPLFWEMCTVSPRATDDIFAKLPRNPLVLSGLLDALPYVTGHRFHRSELAAAETLNERRELWENWWQEGQAGANRRFDQYYARGDLEAIERQGFAALPRIMEKLEEGHTDLLPVLRWIIEPQAQRRGHPTLLLRVDHIPLWPGHMTQEEAADKASRCVSWWERNKEKWLIPFPDQHTE